MYYKVLYIALYYVYVFIFHFAECALILKMQYHSSLF